MKTASKDLGEGAGREELQRDFIAEPAKQQRFFTSNPRHLRVLIAITRRPMPREHVDIEAGASNGPELVAELRRRGLDVPCARVPCMDKDGFEVRRGVHYLTRNDRRIIREFFRWLNAAQ